MNEIHFALAEELEKLAAGYRKLAHKPKKVNQISIQDISYVLSEKIGLGKTSEIKDLLKKYDAEKLVEVRPENYEAIFEEAKKL